jgi:hypothetical protein
MEFLGRAIHPPPPDPAVMDLHKRLAPLKRAAGLAVSTGR